MGSPDTPAPVGSLVIINPGASRLKNERTRADVMAELARALGERDGVEPTILVPDSAEDIGPAVAAAADAGAPAIIAAGGDGTVTAVASALGERRVAVGIIPGGTGNILAGVLGIPDRPRDAARALATSVPRAIDLGEVELTPLVGPMERRAFAIGCGMGFDARLMAATPPELKRRFGRSAYFAQAALEALRITAVPFHVTVDGEHFETHASIALVTNVGELVPGLLRPRLPVIPDDGLLDIFVVGARGPISGVRHLIGELRRTELGARPGAPTLRVRGRDVAISSLPPEPIQVDGDPYWPGSLRARIRPGALSVLVPPGGAARAPAAGAAPGL